MAQAVSEQCLLWTALDKLTASLRFRGIGNDEAISTSGELKLLRK